MTALTDAEANAPTLDPDPPPDVDSLRARITALDPDTMALFVAAWQSSGLPTALRDADGHSLPLELKTYKDIEAIVAGHEPAADAGALAVAFTRLHALPPGPRFAVKARMALFGYFIPEDGLAYTTGRLTILERMLDNVEAEATDEVATLLGPVVAGQVVAVPVADVAALAMVPPTGTVDEIVRKIADNVELARVTLAAELAKAKPRKGLVAKLEQVAGTVAPPLLTPSPADPEPDEGGHAWFVYKYLDLPLGPRAEVRRRLELHGITDVRDAAQFRGDRLDLLADTLDQVRNEIDAAEADKAEADTIVGGGEPAVLPAAEAPPADGYAQGYVDGLRAAADALRVMVDA